MNDHCKKLVTDTELYNSIQSMPDGSKQLTHTFTDECLMNLIKQIVLETSSMASKGGASLDTVTRIRRKFLA